MFVVQNYGHKVSIYDTRVTIFSYDIKQKSPPFLGRGFIVSNYLLEILTTEILHLGHILQCHYS